MAQNCREVWIALSQHLHGSKHLHPLLPAGLLGELLKGVHDQWDQQGAERKESLVRERCC